MTRIRVLDVGLACLALLAGGGGLAQPLWVPEGAPLTVVHGSFHVHTQWSARRWNDSHPPSAVDHARCEPPERTLAAAAAAGLQVIAFADHCYQLDPREWGLRPWPAGLLPTADTDWRSLTILGNSGGESGPNKCLAMAGFEWTPGANWWEVLNRRWGYGKTGHVNIFYPGLSAADLQDEAVAKAHPILYARQESGGSIVFAREVPGAAIDCPDLNALHARLRGLMKRDPAAAPLAQFDHPVAKIGIGDPSRGIEQYPGHFDDFAFDPALVDCFVLFEVATVGTREHGIERRVWCDLIDNEPLYQRALARGWRLGPAIGVDNDDEEVAGAASAYTGVWLPQGTFTVRDVAAALRQRRVFATEIPRLTLAVEALEPDGGVVPMGGQAQVRDGEKLQLQARFSMEDGSTLSPLSYVRVVEVRADGAARTTETPLDGEGRLSIAITPDAGTKCVYVRAARARQGRQPERGIISAPIWTKIADGN